MLSNTKNNPQKVCDFCISEDLDIVYEVPDSRLGVRIAVCNYCGLVQSISTKEKNSEERVISTSSDANWGNIRHGKGLRLPVVSKIIDSFVSLDEIQKVLDVGANRGDFIKWLCAKNPSVNIVAVEPDISLINEFKTLPNLTLYICKLENTELPENYFNFVYCSHTLEHAESASEMLETIQKCMKMNSYLFLEVPNIDVLKTNDNVEEFFIDKHSFHFNHSILLDYLTFLGYEKIHDVTDIFNITFLLRKISNKESQFKSENINLVEGNKNMIRNYANILQSNRNKLRNIAERLHQFMDRQKVVFWGTGRLFDALVRYGGLKTDKIYGIIDEYLWRILPSVHNIEIKKPEYLKTASPDVVIVLARSSADEIINKVHGLGIRHAIKFSDLFLAVQ